jgi:hypothetical protein
MIHETWFKRHAFIDYLILVLSLPATSNANTAAISASEGQSRPHTPTVMVFLSLPTQKQLRIGHNNTLGTAIMKPTVSCMVFKITEMYSRHLLKRD